MARTCEGAALISREFYLDPPDLVARKLLGKLLVREAEWSVALSK